MSGSEVSPSDDPRSAPPGEPTRSEAWMISATVLALIAVVFAVAAVFVASDARSTADDAEAVAQNAGSVAPPAVPPSTEPGTTPTSSVAPSPGMVLVTEKEFSIIANPAVVPAGRLTLKVSNVGKARHELVVIKTDNDPAHLPTNSTGAIENGQGDEKIAELSKVPAGSTRKLAVDLEPGMYVLICNLPGHYGAGMHTGLTVS
jgi:uncharacterized cupredoxin-like copper-binding protein